jgi:ribosome maturation factor RimP
VDGRRRFSGTLLRRGGEEIVVRVDDRDLRVPLAEVEVVRLVPQL